MSEKGLGILCDERDEEAAAELLARCAERRRLDPEYARRMDEEGARYTGVMEAIEEWRERAAAAERSAALQPALDSIDAALGPLLKKELAAENAQARITARHKKDFARFRACCAEWKLPHLPASPQAVAIFLSNETEHGARHVCRLARSISIMHRAVNFTDPTEDVLVRAILRLARTDKSNLPRTKETEH
jgi:hypothetical protein